MKIMILSLVLFAQTLMADAKAPELTIYTSRKSHLIEPLINTYSAKTGVVIKHVNGKAGALIQRLKQEGANTPADLLITVDAGNLGFAAQENLLLPLNSDKLNQAVPETFRDKQARWFGLSLRARTIFYNKNKVKKIELKSYGDLASPKWKGKLCLRTSRKVYNQSLVASMIERIGKAKTEKVVKGWVSNLAKPVFTSDTQLLEAIDRGDCHVGIANTYYLARLKKKNKAQNVSVFWTPKSDGGVHVNVSGGGVVKASKNPKQAQAFLEWLANGEAQKIFAELNEEYPVVSGISVSPTLKSWGEFDKDKTPLSSIAPLQKQAVMLMDQAKYL